MNVNDSKIYFTNTFTVEVTAGTIDIFEEDLEVVEIQVGKDASWKLPNLIVGAPNDLKFYVSLDETELFLSFDEESRAFTVSGEKLTAEH